MRERNSLIAAPEKISGTSDCTALVYCTACSNFEVDGKAECSFTEIQRCVNSVVSSMKLIKLEHAVQYRRALQSHVPLIFPGAAIRELLNYQKLLKTG